MGKEKNERNFGITKRTLCKDLEKIYAQAIEKGQLQIAIKAIDLLTNLLGYRDGEDKTQDQQNQLPEGNRVEINFLTVGKPQQQIPQQLYPSPAELTEHTNTNAEDKNTAEASN